MDKGERNLKPIIIHSRNPLVREFLELLCKYKRMKYRVENQTEIRLPKSYNGPAIVDDDVTVYYFSQIVQYLEQRMLAPSAIPMEPKKHAQSMILTMELLSNPQNHEDTISAALESRKPFVMTHPTIIDLALAAISSDTSYINQILDHK